MNSTPMTWQEFFDAWLAEMSRLLGLDVAFIGNLWGVAALIVVLLIVANVCSKFGTDEDAPFEI